MEPQSATMPAVCPQPLRRRRWLRGLLLLLALAVLTPAGVFSYAEYAADQDWLAAAADAERSDPHWRLETLVAEQEPIADQDNSALEIRSLAGRGLSFQIAQAGNYDVIFGKQQANTQLNAEQLELIHDFLRLIARPIEDARRLKDMPRGRFPVVYTHGIIDAPQTDYRCAINVADLLRHHAYDLAHDGKMVEAIHACQACLNTGRAMREDFFVMAFLARCSCQWSALSALDRVLAQGEVSEDTLKPTQSLLEKESKESGWLNAMRGERAYLHSYAEGIRAGNIENCLPGVPPGATPRNLTEWISEAFPSTKTKYCPDFLRQMTEYVEIAKLPIHRRIPRAEQWAKKCSDSPNPVICVTGSIYAGYHRYEIESQARLRAAVVATACERYRLRHQFGLWPITLDMLVDEKLLDAIPLDPTDGKPLRYRKTKDNILIYSQGVDIGFRLWNVDRRRQPALPPVKLEN